MKETSSRRVLAIGLEAVNPDLLRAWGHAGHLPVLQGLLERGLWSTLASTTELSSGATWPSLITGANPGKHGYAFYHRQLKPGTYELTKIYADEMGCEPFWHYLARDGRRMVIFDIPTSRPLDHVPGLQVTGWGAESENWPSCSLPPELLGEIRSRFGHHPLDGWYEKKPETAGDLQALLDAFIGGTRTRVAAAEMLDEREDWDFFFVAFPEAHTFGHLCWHLHDESHPDHDPELRARFGDPLLKVYREIDAAIGRLVARHPDATLMIFSNTGMDSNFSGIHLVPEILKRLGMRPEPGTKGGLKQALLRFTPQQKWGPNTIKEVERLLSPQLIEKVRRRVPKRFWDRWSRRLLNLGADWPHARAFSLPNDCTGAIQINLEGREPNGKVPATEYDAVCEQLAEAFGELINPATGRPAVDAVIRTRQVCHGPLIDNLPDLIVVWNREAPIDAVESPRIGRIAGALPDRRSGAHTLEGFVLAAGNGLRAAASAGQPTIMDIAPTILSLFGETRPPHMDGRPLVEAETADLEETGVPVMAD